MKRTIQHIIGFILIQILMLIPILNVYIVLKVSKQTIGRWGGYKSPLYRHTGDIKVTLSDGSAELVIVYEGALDDLMYAESKAAKIIRNTEIKYVEVEDNILTIRLWNENKINGLYNIRNER